MVLSESGKQDEAQKALTALAEMRRALIAFWRACMRQANRLQKITRNPPAPNIRALPGTRRRRGLREFARVQLATLSLSDESYDELARDLDSLRSGTSRWRSPRKKSLA